MIKVNYELDENNYITSFQTFPFDENLPYFEIENISQIKIGFSKVINDVFYSQDELAKLIRDVKQELIEIGKWLSNNDWKINKIIVGEWTTDDSRWVTYLNERSIKRSRRDELINILKTNGYEQ